MPESNAATLLEKKLAALQGWAIGFALALMLATGGLIGYGAWQKSANAAQAAETRIENRRYFCEQIENLKTGERKAAWESWNNLGKTLKILGLTKTPEVVDAARKSRDDKLRRYAAVNCELVAHGLIPSK